MTSKYVGHEEPVVRPLRKVLAVAIQTDDAGTFIEAAATCDSMLRQSEHFTTPEALMKNFVRFTYRGWEMLLHQADHDMRYLIPALEALVSQGFKTTFTIDGRGRIIFVTIKSGGHSWYIRDATSMIPLEEEELRGLAGVGPTIPLELVLLRAYKRFAGTLLDTFGVRPSITIGTTAIHAWARTLPDHHIFYRQREEVEAMAREGSFGGLVWLNGLAERHNCAYIDVNAMYAHAMRQGVPVMSPSYTEVYYHSLPGIYQCTVIAPDDIPFTFVPCRNANGFGVSYPRGKVFESVLCSNTIELAREHGYQITVQWGYVFEKLGYPFDDFVSKCQTIENEYRGDNARVVVKSLRNSICGKFGQRTEGKEYYLTPNPSIDMTPVETWDGEIIDNLYYREIEIERSYMQPVWFAWITAQARNMLARMVYALGPKNVYYGDTDGLVIDGLVSGNSAVDYGTQYGEWKLEEQYLNFAPKGGKTYEAITTDGEIIIRAAGIKRGVLTHDQMARLLPHHAPVVTHEYQEEHKAILTTGNRPHRQSMTKTLEIPELRAEWQTLEL